MTLFPNRRDDLDPARGVIAAPLLILGLALGTWALFVLAWPALLAGFGVLAVWRWLVGWGA